MKVCGCESWVATDIIHLTLTVISLLQTRRRGALLWTSSARGRRISWSLQTLHLRGWTSLTSNTSLTTTCLRTLRTMVRVIVYLLIYIIKLKVAFVLWLLLFVFVTQLRYADKRIVSIMNVHIERNNCFVNSNYSNKK